MRKGRNRLWIAVLLLVEHAAAALQMEGREAFLLALRRVRDERVAGSEAARDEIRAQALEPGRHAGRLRDGSEQTREGALPLGFRGPAARVEHRRHNGRRQLCRQHPHATRQAAEDLCRPDHDRRLIQR